MEESKKQAVGQKRKQGWEGGKRTFITTPLSQEQNHSCDEDINLLMRSEPS
jgi:hypothetical protein